MDARVTDKDLGIIFRDARTLRRWAGRPVSDEILRVAYDLMKLAPTSANCSPARIVFVRSPEAKTRLKPSLSAGNLEQTMTAPVTAIFAYDTLFYDHLPRLFPQADARSWFAGDAKAAETTALRNGSLQAAYFMLAARALGLDCGPMSGFDNAKVDAAFFPDGRVKSNFLCNLGYGDRTGLPPRNPRLSFEETCAIV
ncbi:MAG: malonic semialdehyde reductase [Alphaproteobacteria bacterium]